MEKRFKTMKERPATERPYEKCLEYGPESLSDGELLAVILRSGTRECSALELAWKILEKHPVYKGIAGLYHMKIGMLKEIPGIGNVKAIEILCILELSKRLSRASVAREADFSSPDYIAAYYMESMRHLEEERVLLLLLDGKHHLMKEVFLSQGTANSAYVSVKSIFIEAFRHGQCISYCFTIIRPDVRIQAERIWCLPGRSGKRENCWGFLSRIILSSETAVLPVSGSRR